MSGLTLFAIEDALLELARAREELTDPAREVNRRCDECAGTGRTDNHVTGEVECSSCGGSGQSDDAAELAEVDKAIAEYAQCREPAKVDSIHGLLKQWHITAAVARQEARESQERAQRLEANEARLKALVCQVMEMAGKKRIEGTAGRAITRQANGGMSPLVVQGWDAESEKWIDDPDILPDDYRYLTVRLTMSQWLTLLHASGSFEATRIRSEPANALIREALAKPCPVCAPPYDGNRAVEDLKDCPDCGGTGKASGPGASLGERGFSLRLK